MFCVLWGPDRLGALLPPLAGLDGVGVEAADEHLALEFPMKTSVKKARTLKALEGPAEVHAICDGNIIQEKRLGQTRLHNMYTCGTFSLIENAARASIRRIGLLQIRHVDDRLAITGTSTRSTLTVG